MAKPPSSAIGIDVGRHSMKAVLLQRRGSNRFVLSNYATRELPEEPRTVEALAANFKALMHDLGGKGKATGIAVSSTESLVRIIEQSPMPVALLRDALRLNSTMLLNQDCKDLVLDCDLIPSSEPQNQPAAGSATTQTGAAAPAAPEQCRYVVGGLPRMRVQMVHEACLKTKIPATALQVTPIAVLNAFEFANKETFDNQAFVLVDIGHVSTTVIVGAKRELILVRTLEYGGRTFVGELICHGASSFEEIVTMLKTEEVLTVENARLSLTELVRSISSSIGFFEARREEPVPRIFVSGGMAKSPMILKLLTEELQLPCDSWSPFAKCELNLSASRKSALTEHLPSLAVACGAAAELLTSR